jgi:UDP-N-acetylmuramyl pentapeptide phosphotransferase/UDP-N-acetylglucosamine-1-phosphate transferase
MEAPTILFLVGLVDDFLNIKPYQKLIGHLIRRAAVVVVSGFLCRSRQRIIDIWLTVFWLIALRTRLICLTIWTA